MGRAENIQWLIDAIQELGTEIEDHKVPFPLAVNLAMRLSVSKKTAIAYVDQLRRTRIFPDDRYAFIIDPEKEISLPKTKSGGLLQRMDRKLDRILEVLEKDRPQQKMKAFSAP